MAMIRQESRSCFPRFRDLENHALGQLLLSHRTWNFYSSRSFVIVSALAAVALAAVEVDPEVASKVKTKLSNMSKKPRFIDTFSSARGATVRPCNNVEPITFDTSFPEIRFFFFQLVDERTG